MSRLPPAPPPRQSLAASASSSSSTSSRPPPASFSLTAEALGDSDELDAGRETSWLQPFHRSWEALEEDASGLLLTSTIDLQRQRKAALPVDPPSVISKGVIRSLVLVLDFSSSMAQTDLKPSRRLLTLSLLSSFITDFFDQNPLSQLSFVLGHRGVAVKVTELSGHPVEQMRVLRDKAEKLLMDEEKAQRTGSASAAGGGGSGAAATAAAAVAASGGSFSLQNCLEMARSTLSGVPSFASREVLCIVSSLSTVDAGDINATVAAMQQHHIVCSVVHLAAELFICSHLAQETGGRHVVVMSKEHYASVLRSFLPPMPSTAASAANRRWMRMGFPQQVTTPYPLLCSCHSLLTYTAYTCPHCLSRYCELPTQCNICSLQLVSSPQLARTYHHLFPSPHFAVREQQAAAVSARCRGCMQELLPGEDLQCVCVECGASFCINCDEFVHLVLHHCPACIAGDKRTDSEAAQAAVASKAAHSSKGGSVPQVKMEPVIVID